MTNNHNIPQSYFRVLEGIENLDLSTLNKLRQYKESIIQYMEIIDNNTSYYLHDIIDTTPEISPQALNEIVEEHKIKLSLYRGQISSLNYYINILEKRHQQNLNTLPINLNDVD